VTSTQISQMIESLIERRHPSSICPSEVARALRTREEDWRALMPKIRAAALELSRNGRLLITQRGRVLSADEPIIGAIRLSSGPLRSGELDDPENDLGRP
jgi:uncharacterized protein (DUF2461 family)